LNLEASLRKLSAAWMVVMHVTNRHLELAPVVASVAAENGLLARVSDTARSDEDFGKLTRATGWNPKVRSRAMGVD